jgi:MerR family copper efflux transcriptional regulator
MEGLTTAELAKEGGVNIETIRYYERHRLLPKPPRTPSGYRKFSNDYVTRLQFIRHSQELGFTLKEVKELLAIRVKPGSSCADVRRKTEAKVADVDEKIRRLQAIREALIRMTAACAGRGFANDMGRRLEQQEGLKRAPDAGVNPSEETRRLAFDTFFTDALEDMIDANFTIYKKIKDDPNFGALFRAAMYQRVAKMYEEQHGAMETSSGQ